MNSITVIAIPTTMYFTVNNFGYIHVIIKFNYTTIAAKKRLFKKFIVTIVIASFYLDYIKEASN